MDNREENLGKVKEIADLQKRLQELEKDEAWKRAVSENFYDFILFVLTQTLKLF